MLENIDIGQVFLWYFCLLFSLCIHEAAHAAMANWCGDPSARLLGRLTLNPAKHIDPMGTVVFPLLLLMMPGGFVFGWAKPVPFNPRNLENMRRDPVLIALAGPGSNLVLALICAFALRVLAMLVGIAPDSNILAILVQIFLALSVINLILMLFNMIPVPPLDGHYLLASVLPPSGQEMLQRIGPFGIILAIMLVSFTGIIRVPLTILQTCIFYLAFYGTPLWG